MASRSCSVVERAEQQVIGRDRRGQPGEVGEMPVQVGAHGHEAAGGMVDESIGERDAFVGVVAEGEELFELIDDERARRQRRPVRPSGGRRA